MTTKIVERAAFEHLKVYIEERLPGAKLIDTMNKGAMEAHPDVADAILEYDGRVHYIEIKSSTKRGDYNVRFSHQTITKAINRDVIVALITNLESGSPTFDFFRLADIASELRIEPMFFIARKNTVEMRKPLTDLLSLPDGAINITGLLNSTIRSHINDKYLVGETTPVAETGGLRANQALAPDAPLWSPFETEFDADGEPHPPWLMYPNMPITSMGWRMGEGEYYNEAFGTWLQSHPREKLAAYVAKYPIPPSWRSVWRALAVAST